MNLRDLPEGPAHTWGTFAYALERLEEATGQFVHVALPDFLDQPGGVDMDMVYDRLANTVEQLRTAAIVLWMKQAGL